MDKYIQTWLVEYSTERNCEIFFTTSLQISISFFHMTTNIHITYYTYIPFIRSVRSNKCEAFYATWEVWASLAPAVACLLRACAFYAVAPQSRRSCLPLFFPFIKFTLFAVAPKYFTWQIYGHVFPHVAVRFGRTQSTALSKTSINIDGLVDFACK